MRNFLSRLMIETDIGAIERDFCSKGCSEFDTCFILHKLHEIRKFRRQLDNALNAWGFIWQRLSLMLVSFSSIRIYWASVSWHKCINCTGGNPFFKSPRQLCGNLLHKHIQPNDFHLHRNMNTTDVNINTENRKTVSLNVNIET